jgi:hypothetical protein
LSRGCWDNAGDDQRRSKASTKSHRTDRMFISWESEKK